MYQLPFRKRWFSFLLMFVSIVIVSGCHEEDPPAISVSQNLIEVGYERSSTLISVVTNSEWTAVSNADWCRLSRTSGRFSTELDVVIDECASDTKRSAVITLTTQGRNSASTTILVSQSAENCSLTITPGEITVGNMGETVAFAVAASPSIEYTVSSSADWAVPAVKTGKGNGTVKVAVAANTSHSIARSAVITLAMKNDSEVLLAQFTVHQLSRRIPVIHLGQEALSFKQNAVTLKEHAYLIPVISNITGNMIVTSDFTWCKGELEDINGVRFVRITTLGDNNANEARDCVVTIVGDVDGEAVTTQINVSQAGLGSPIVSLFREVVTIDQHVNDVTVGYVPANASMKLAVENDFPTWIEDVKINTTLKTITFRVKANETQDSRTGTVTLSAILGNECMIYPITVVQNGLGEANITVTPAQLTLPAKLTNTTEYLATVVAQTRYSSMAIAVAEGADWLTITKVQGTNSAADAITEQVKVVAAENTGNDARTATVLLTFKYGTSTIVRTLTVVQAGLGDPTITITNPNISMPYTVSTETIQYTRSSDHITVTKAVSDETWISNVALSGNSAITFAVSENKGTEARTGTITVYATRDGMTFTYPVTITQAGYGDVDIRISPSPISLAAALNMTDGTGNVTTSFTVVANHPDAVITKVAGATVIDWLSVDNSKTTGLNTNSAIVGLTARPNTTYFDREAIVVVTIEWGNQQVLREVKVTQAHWGGTADMYSIVSAAPNNFVVVDGKKIWVSGSVTGESIILDPSSEEVVITNVEVKEGSWLSVAPGYIDGRYRLTHRANDTDAPRTALVEVSLRYGNSLGTQTAKEVYVVTQGPLLYEIDLSTPLESPIIFEKAQFGYDRVIRAIPEEGLDLTTINIQAPEGAIITAIRPDSRNNSIQMSPASTPMTNKAAFAISAALANYRAGAYDWWEIRTVEIDIQSQDHDGWIRTITVTIYQRKRVSQLPT